MQFKPERFLATEKQVPEPDPHTLVFGFGRRICPGRLLADTALFINIAQALSVFKIGKAVENGQEIDPVVDFLPGVVSHPASFRASIKPRSSHHEALVRNIEQTHPWQKSDAKLMQYVVF
jgi:cytochrome P450